MSDRKNNTKYEAADFMKADFFKTDVMKDDVLKYYQVLAQQSWEAMVGQLKKPPQKDDFISSIFPADSTPSVTIEHALSGLKSYAEWMQGAAASVGTPGNDWAQQLEQLFGKDRQPFASAFAGVDPGTAAGTQDFSRQWQAWLQSLQGNPSSTAYTESTAQAMPPFATFGADLAAQAEQQRLMAAVTEHLEAASRYQRLIQRSNEHAIEKMRARLAPLAQPTAKIESLKMLYDVWVECAEEAHAEIALSDEFRETYAAMVNTQMRVRLLQQAQVEKICAQVGIPTRSDIDNLGQRLHEFRREMRGGSAAAPNAQSDELRELRREVAELRALIAGRDTPSSAARARAGTSSEAPAAKKSSAVKKAASNKTSSNKAASSKTASSKTALGKTVPPVGRRASKEAAAAKKSGPATSSGKLAKPASTRKKK